MMEIRYDIDAAKKIIEEPLKKEWIKQRVQGGAKLDYIEGARVIEILNRAFNYQWDFEIIQSEIIQAEPYKGKNDTTVQEQGKYLSVLGRLVVPGLGSKMAFGSKSIIGRVTEQESVYKAAMTDSLKKAATLFGVGKELYLDDIDVAPKVEAAPKAPVDDEFKALATKLKEYKQVLGIGEGADENEKLNPYVKEWSGGTHTSWREVLVKDKLKAFVSWLGVQISKQ